MIQELLTVPTYSKYMYLQGYSPQEIYSAGKQHFYELSVLENEVPEAIEAIIDRSLDELLKGFE
jgi:hypothetical protein